jgi:hydrogenase maturation protein HypF
LSGDVVAIKGLGGFHLACRADRDDSVAALRERKGREAKPLALMVRDLEQARCLVELSAFAEAELLDVSRPIVLAPRKQAATASQVSASVAPATDLLGLMLPYTPLHMLLMQPPMPPLVMTSGNPSSEPLSARNDDAKERLAHIADGFLLHDRDIERPIDDSVVLATPELTHPLMVRRARGFVPQAIPLKIRSKRPILALGGDLKSVVCFWPTTARSSASISAISKTR